MRMPIWGILIPKLGILKWRSNRAFEKGLYQGLRHRSCSARRAPRGGPSGIENAKCRHTLVDDAVEEVNKAALTALDAGRNPENRTARR